MIEFVKMMRRVNETPVDEQKDLFEDEEAFEYFVNKFLSPSAKYIFTTKNFLNDEALNFANHLLT